MTVIGYQLLLQRKYYFNIHAVLYRYNNFKQLILLRATKTEIKKIH